MSEAQQEEPEKVLDETVVTDDEEYRDYSIADQMKGLERIIKSTKPKHFMPYIRNEEFEAFKEMVQGNLTVEAEKLRESPSGSERKVGGFHILETEKGPRIIRSPILTKRPDGLNKAENSSQISSFEVMKKYSTQTSANTRSIQEKREEVAYPKMDQICESANKAENNENEEGGLLDIIERNRKRPRIDLASEEIKLHQGNSEDSSSNGLGLRGPCFTVPNSPSEIPGQVTHQRSLNVSPDKKQNKEKQKSHFSRATKPILKKPQLELSKNSNQLMRNSEKKVVSFSKKVSVFKYRSHTPNHQKLKKVPPISSSRNRSSGLSDSEWGSPIDLKWNL